MNFNRTVIVLILIMTTVPLTALAVAFGILYYTSIKERSASHVQIAKI